MAAKSGGSYVANEDGSTTLVHRTKEQAEVASEPAVAPAPEEKPKNTRKGSSFKSS